MVSVVWFISVCLYWMLVFSVHCRAWSNEGQEPPGGSISIFFNSYILKVLDRILQEILCAIRRSFTQFKVLIPLCRNAQLYVKVFKIHLKLKALSNNRCYWIVTINGFYHFKVAAGKSEDFNNYIFIYRIISLLVIFCINNLNLQSSSYKLNVVK